MACFVLRKLILQTRTHSHPVGLNDWFLVGPIVYFHTLCVRTAKALARLRWCAGSPEPSLVAFVISTTTHFCSIFIQLVVWGHTHIAFSRILQFCNWVCFANSVLFSIVITSYGQEESVHFPGHIVWFHGFLFFPLVSERVAISDCDTLWRLFHWCHVNGTATFIHVRLVSTVNREVEKSYVYVHVYL